jgi:Heterokaryon incompatibility protein (HET)
MWIDALCIYQDSIDEKNAQLLLMPEIYKTAQSVPVWLGPEENDSDLAYFFLTRLNVFFRTEERKYKYLDGCRAVADEAVRHTAAWRTEQSGSTVTTREFSFTAWRALADLLRRPWFRRVWVIQEVLMGQNVLMICGVHKAS